jgi:ABC-type sugar transport system substrate-binding protein
MRLLAILSLFVSTSLFACPDLAGKYPNCRSQTGNTDGVSNLVITQSVSGRVTTFVMTSTDAQTHDKTTDTLRADGVPVVATENDPSTGASMQLSTTVSCVGTKAVSVKMSVKFNNEPMAQMTTLISKSGKILTMESTGNSSGVETKETIICE